MQKSKRIIFFSGKGGVGKTSAAAATALACADSGLHTILLSVDPAHNVLDIFQFPQSTQTVQVTNHLSILEINPFTELEANWGNIRDYIASLMSMMGAEETIAGELAILPGMDNLFSLLRILDFHNNSQYQVIVVDMAPTGDSLRLLSLPQIVSVALRITRYLEKYIFSPVIRPASRVSKSLRSMVAPSDVTKSWETILERILALKRILEEKESVSTRLVLNPEKLAIAETQRALTYFSLFGMPVDQIIVNRILPQEANSPFLKEWMIQQADNLERIRQYFSPWPIREAPMMKQEICGLAKLMAFGKAIYGQDNPSQVFFVNQPLKITSTAKIRQIAVQLPFLDINSTEISVDSRGGDLLIHWGSYLRVYRIPDSFTHLVPDVAEYRNGWLEINFIKTKGLHG